MALRSLSRFVCTVVLVISLLSVTNRALSVTFEQVCQGLDDVITNANSAVLSPCMRDNNCTMVQCQVSDDTTAMFIRQSALTFLPCEDPPSVRLELWNPSMMVLIDQVFNETRTVTVDTIGAGPLPLTVTVSWPTDSEIRIMIEYNLLGSVQTLIGSTIVPVDTSTCTVDATTNDPGAADNTTQSLDSSTSEGRATTLTSGLAVALALTLCLLILT